MNKDKLHNYLQNNFDGTSLDELQELVETYPYFQGARILLSKASANEEHHAFESHLNKAAIHAGSRVALFNQVMGEKIQEKVAKIEKELDAVEEDSESEELDLDSSEEDNLEFKSIVADADARELPVIDAEQLEENTDEALHSELMVATGDDDRGSDLMEEGESAEEVESNEQALSQNEMELLEEEVEDVNAKEDVEKFKSMDDLSQGVLIGAISRSLELEVTPEQNIAKGKEQEAKEERDEHSNAIGVDEQSSVGAFTQWVYQRAVEMNYVSQESVEEQKLNSSVEDLQGKDKNELIDRFIAFEPKITRGKAAEYSTPEQAADALLEDDEWVTETLAAVYASQGNIKKAKKAYKLLSLKFPEKSIYFANQIKKLGSQPNTKK